MFCCLLVIVRRSCFPLRLGDTSPVNFMSSCMPVSEKRFSRSCVPSKNCTSISFENRQDRQKMHEDQSSFSENNGHFSRAESLSSGKGCTKLWRKPVELEEQVSTEHCRWGSVSVLNLLLCILWLWFQSYDKYENFKENYLQNFFSILFLIE